MTSSVRPRPASPRATGAGTPPDGRAQRQRVLVELGAFGRRISEAIAADLGEAELTGNAPVLLLCELALDGPLRPKQLQAMAGLTSGGMTKQLDRFEQLGLIERAFGEVAGDRRAILVSLTPRGHEVAGRMAAVLDAHLDDVRSLLAELATLIDSPDDAGTTPGS